MNWCSIRLQIRKDRIKNQSAPIRLVVTIYGKRWRKDLGVNVPLKYWDENNAVIIGKNADVAQTRFLVEGYFAKAHKILIDMHLSGASKTVAEFENRFDDKLERNCFIKFMEQQSKERYMHGELTLGTYNHCLVVLNKIKAFTKKTTLGFDEITPEWLLRFERFDKTDIAQRTGTRKTNAQNTVANHLKKIHTYIRIAIVKGIINKDPFNGYKIKLVETHREFLTEGDIKKLIDLYRSGRYAEGSTAFGVLKNFLLMCSTGMRVSDLKNFKRSMIRDEMIVFVPHKTRSKNKTVKIPLNFLSKEIIDSFDGEYCRFKISDQKQNEWLKIIASNANLSVRNLTNHIARHSFASLFLKKGGKIEMLQSLLAHNSIQTTMRYVHTVDEERIRQVSQAFDGF